MKPAALSANVQLVGLPEYKDAAKEWIKSQPKKKKGEEPYNFGDVPLEIIGPYAAIDALAVVRIVNLLLTILTEEQMYFYRTIAHEVLLCSVELCIEGYEISQDRYNYTKLYVEAQIKEIYNQCIHVVNEHIDSFFNINSNQQLQTLLFEKLQMPILHKTAKGSPAVGSKVLADLILFHPFVFYLTKVKKVIKLYTSYVQSYPNVLGRGSRHVHRNGRTTVLNAQLKQINRTARLSSSNMSGHKKTKKKGGSLLTLPAHGSMVKHYFEPDEVVSLENDLYNSILADLKETDPARYSNVMEALSQDATRLIKPAKPPKKIRVTKKENACSEE